ncbi:DUF4371 domain-containing protein [Trichonephila clavipes]|nr:DUF4371 domain-containing protein [Trichonephila clavipes]
MIGGSADIDICKIPLSNDTIHRRIKDMSENIEQNTAKTLANSNFALQVDETTDITGNAQLIAFVRFIHENDIINQFLCCRELPDFTHNCGKESDKLFNKIRNTQKIKQQEKVDVPSADVSSTHSPISYHLVVSTQSRASHQMVPVHDLVFLKMGNLNSRKYGYGGGDRQGSHDPQQV